MPQLLQQAAANAVAASSWSSLTVKAMSFGGA